MKKITLFLLSVIIVSNVNALTIKEAQQYALQHNDSLISAYKKVQAGKYKVFESVTSMLPKVSASYSYLYMADVPKLEMTSMDPTTHQPVTREIEMGKADNYDFKAGVQQPIFMWGKLYNAYKLSKIGLENSELDYTSGKKGILFGIKTAYYGALLSREQVKLAQESLNQLKIHYASVKKRFDAGLASNLDLIQVDVKKADAQRMLITAKNSYKIALLNLKSLIGKPLTADITLDDKFEQVKYAVDKKTIYKRALDNDIQLKKMRNSLKMLKITKKMQRTSNLPSVFASANMESKNPYNFQDKWGTNKTFMLMLNMDLFKGGATFTQLKQIHFQEQALKKGISFYKKTLELKIETLLSDIYAAQQQIDVSKLQVQQAEEGYNAAKEQYENGLVSNLDFINTQLMLLQAKVGYNAAIFGYNQKIFELQKIVERDK